MHAAEQLRDKITKDEEQADAKSEDRKTEYQN
jgi:hypothetical protein